MHFLFGFQLLGTDHQSVMILQALALANVSESKSRLVASFLETDVLLLASVLVLRWHCGLGDCFLLPSRLNAVRDKRIKHVGVVLTKKE